MKKANQSVQYTAPLPEYPQLQWCWYLLEEMDPVLLYDMLALQWRKRGIARLMTVKALEKAESDFPSQMVKLDAQTYLQGFYETLGFRSRGDEFLEDGIPHVRIQLTD